MDTNSLRPRSEPRRTQKVWSPKYIAPAAMLFWISLISTAAALDERRYEVIGSRLYFNSEIPFPDDPEVGLLRIDENEMHYYLDKNPDVRTVVLTSYGGSSITALLLARKLEEFGVDTEVRGPCFSACATLFLAGERRTLPKGAILGFHRAVIRAAAITKHVGRWHDGPVNSDDVAKIYGEGAESAAGTLRNLLDRGISIDFALKTLDAAPGAMWLPTRDELEQAGVITP